MRPDLEQWLRLSLIPGLGPVRIRQLLRYFSSPDRILDASLEELSAVPGIGVSTAKIILKERGRVDVKKELGRIRSSGVRILTLNDEGYPNSLREIYDPPPVLYVKGDLLPTDMLSVAIVGTRRATAYGKQVARSLAGELASRGVTVVSGLATGIDSYAHTGALESSGRTIAVLGTGIDICYPSSNTGLYRDIPKSGAVITEFPFSTKPDRHNFPRRNRCISGLSLGVVVVEAPEKSGALITANFALEQGREVFSVPGNIFNRQSKGTHALIKEGAVLVHDVEDVLREIRIWSPVTRPPSDRISRKEQDMTSDERTVYGCLSSEPLHIDTLCEKTRLPISRLSNIMLDLEISGRAVQTGQKFFIRGV